MFVAMAVGVVIGIMIAPKLSPSYWNGNRQSRATMAQQVTEVMDLVADEYVDRVDYDSLTDDMMNAMLATLDPHSRYLSAEELKRQREDIRGNFEGTGIVLHMQDDTVCVGRIVEHSPASKCDIRPGDRILRVDRQQVSGVKMPTDSVVRRIRGPKYSVVNLGVRRVGESGLREVRVHRNVIPTPSLAASFMLDGRTGYVRISSFTGTTDAEFHDALQRLIGKGMNHLVLDLRDNGGGLLSAAIAIADELLPKGQMIVYTQGTHQRKQEVYATKGGLFEEGQVTVLVNEFSASASEVVTGALQDNDRALVAGRRSFGKGLVQTQFDLSNGSAMLLTVSRYYTPSGRCIQRPYDKGTDEYYMDYLNRILEEDGVADSLLASRSDTVEQFHTRKGRVVYGGGGILPDKIIPYRRDSNMVHYNSLLRKRVIYDEAFDYVTRHYDELRKHYPTLEAYLQGFNPGKGTLDAIVARADRSGIKRDQRSIAKYGSDILTLYKAYVAETLWSSEGFYRVYVAMDDHLQAALKKQ